MTISFRFYAELNAFLEPVRRGRRFEYRLAGAASIKDAIEALGVPHPEIDLILVNDSPVDFTYRLRDGDSVSVYPAFRSIDLSPIERRVGGDLPRPIRFVLDVHLGKLASLLRLTGVDTIVLDDDSAIAECAAREERIVLTRDVALLKRARIRHGRWVRHTDPEEQLAEVLEHFSLGADLRPFSRCLECNTFLTPADEETVRRMVDANIRARFDEFRQCAGCGRVYWRGTHYDRLLDVLERTRRRLADI